MSPLLINSHTFVQVIPSEAEDSLKKINSNRKAIFDVVYHTRIFM